MTSRPMYRRVLVPVFTVALLVGACGGSDSNSASTDEWANDVCVALSTWMQDLANEANSLQAAFGDQTRDPAAAKADFVAFMGSAVDKTDRMIEQVVEEAGTPSGEQGEEMATGFQDGLQEMRQGFANAQDQAEQLPVDNQTAFMQGALTLSQTLEQATRQAQTTLEEVEAKYPEPAKALREEPECQELEQQGG